MKLSAIGESISQLVELGPYQVIVNRLIACRHILSLDRELMYAYLDGEKEMY